KRRLGSALSARSGAAQAREIILRVLTHNLMLLRSPTTGFQQCNHRTKPSPMSGIIRGTDGDDRVLAGSAPETLDGGAGRDTVSFTAAIGRYGQRSKGSTTPTSPV
ncbi:hypothetical protein, partial [Siccirubricoccus deserti]